MQTTSFPFEILIHDDASTDGTADVVRRYESRYPNLIFPVCQSNNQWSEGVRGISARFNFPRARGKYIAMCEGDDYWTDPLKLQKQVDFLEAHPDCAICFHRSSILDDETNSIIGTAGPRTARTIFDLEDLLSENFIPTCSVVFRRGLIPSLPAWYYQLLMGDWPLHILNAQYGKVALLDEVMSVYRVHRGGVWTSSSKLSKVRASCQMLRYLYHTLAPKYQPATKAALADRWCTLVAIYTNLAIQENDAAHYVREALGYLRDLFLEIPFTRTEQRLMHGQIYAAILFAAHKAGKPSLTQYALQRAAAADPSLLSNRGVWSIALRTSISVVRDRMITWQSHCLPRRAE